MTKERQCFCEVYGSAAYRKTRIMANFISLFFVLTVILLIVCVLIPKPTPVGLLLATCFVLGVFALLSLAGCIVWVSEFCKRMKKIKEEREEIEI